MDFKRLLSAGLAYFFDFVVYFRFGGGSSREGNEGKFTRARHGIEKAFSLPELRGSFGAEKAALLMARTRVQLKKCGYDWQVADSHEILERYVSHLNDNCSQVPPEIVAFLSELECVRKQLDTDFFRAGVQLDAPNAALPFEDFSKFFNSRYSVRNFDGELVPEGVVREILQVASKTPSACNRQAWEVKVFQGRAAKQALTFQNGNSGFGHTTTNVMLILGDIRAFVTRERHQVYVDAGMYSMSVILAMHARGISSCPLNMCHSWMDRGRIYRGLGLRSYQVPIMMIAFGTKAKSAKVIRAQRKSVTDIATFIK